MPLVAVMMVFGVVMAVPVPACPAGAVFAVVMLFCAVTAVSTVCVCFVVAMLIPVVVAVFIMPMLMSARLAGTAIFMVMMRVGSFPGKSGQLRHQAVFLFHRVQKLHAGERVPRRGDDGGLFVVPAQQRNGRGQFILRQVLRAAQNDGAGVLDLVVVKFTEVFHINAAFGCIRHGDEARKLHIGMQSLNGADDVGQLAHAGRLDEDTVGMVFVQYLLQRRAKIAHQAAADAAGVHLRYFDTGVFHKAAVDANLTEFIFNEHQQYALVGRGDEFFDERGLARAQESGKNCDFCHCCYLHAKRRCIQGSGV